MEPVISGAATDVATVHQGLQETVHGWPWYARVSRQGKGGGATVSVEYESTMSSRAKDRIGFGPICCIRIILAQSAISGVSIVSAFAAR